MTITLRVLTKSKLKLEAGDADAVNSNCSIYLYHHAAFSLLPWIGVYTVPGNAIWVFLTCGVKSCLSWPSYLWALCRQLKAKLKVCWYIINAITLPTWNLRTSVQFVTIISWLQHQPILYYIVHTENFILPEKYVFCSK